MSEHSDWDVTKENIRPLRQGRPASAVSFAEIIAPKTSSELQMKRAEFEERIKNYKGEDPLGEWISYINWVEASYPKAGAESGLSQLVQNCCSQFYNGGKETKRYYDDERFAKLWIKMAATKSAVKTYAFMFKHEIGHRYPELYVNWAAELESMRRWEEAEKVLEDGMSACSGNVEYLLRLQSVKKGVLDRDARWILDNEVYTEEPEDERDALGGLRPVDKEKKVAPINRVGDSKLHMGKGVLPPVVQKLPMPKGTVKVFAGELEPPSSSSCHDEAPFPVGDEEHENTCTLTTLQTKVTRNSLFSRRLPDEVAKDQLHPGFQILEDVSEGSTRQTKQVNLSSCRKKLTEMSVPVHQMRDDDHGGDRDEWKWVMDPPLSVTKREPHAAVDYRHGEPVPTPADSLNFMWSSTLFPSGSIAEFSFEENLAVRHRRLLSERKFVEMKIREDALADREHLIEQKLTTATELLAKAEQVRHDAEEMRKSAIEQQRVAEDVHQAVEEDLLIVEGLMSGMAACLSALQRDVARDEMDPFDIILSFSEGIKRKLERLIGDDGGRSASGGINMTLDVVNKISQILEDRRTRAVFLSVPTPHDMPATEKVLGGTASENNILSQGNGTSTSWQSSQPLSTAGDQPVNPFIQAMWNQTLNATGRDKSHMGLSRSSSPTEAYSIETAEVEALPLMEPVRQSLAVRKSTKAVEPNSEDEKPRISVPLRKFGGFEIFQDEEESEQPVAHTDAVSVKVKDLHNLPTANAATDVDFGKDNSEAEPQKDCSDEDVIKRHIESPRDSDVQENEAGNVFANNRRRTLRFSVGPDEFNVTRKSIGGIFEQTFQLGSESEFAGAINLEKRMASTPMPVHFGAEGDLEENSKQPKSEVPQPRRSYYALSPIMEGSRESKASSSSGSSCTTQFRSKKSLYNCDTVLEREENQPVDPYAPEWMVKFWDMLEKRLRIDPLFHDLEERTPKVSSGKTVIRLLGEKYVIDEILGEGLYAVVYALRCRTDATKVFALKLQKLNGWWDFYIHAEILRRVSAVPLPECHLQHIIGIESFFRLKDGHSYSLLPLFDQGTLLKLINDFQNSPDKNIPELLAMKLSIDVLRAVESLHSVNIIHGDIKADNVLLQSLRELADAKTPEEFLALPAAVLADFGCGIDLTLYQPNVTFSTDRKGKSTSGYDILQSRPWTFQIDLFGILDVMHSLLFGEYMKVYREKDTWKICKSFKRNWSDIWDTTFQKFLNVPSCDQIPAVSEVRQEFEETALRRLKVVDISRLNRQIRVAVFMQRKSIVS